jgi:hypothetical protein
LAFPIKTVSVFSSILLETEEKLNMSGDSILLILVDVSFKEVQLATTKNKTI